MQDKQGLGRIRESSSSNAVTYNVPDGGDTTPHLSPQAVTGEVLNNDVLLTWNANSEADFSGYRVYYGSSSRSYGLPISMEKTEYLGLKNK